MSTPSQSGPAASAPGSERLTVWGDFTCPWSHLAWLRTERLADDGIEVDWRTVEHDPWHHLAPGEQAARRQALHDELPEVATHLLPGEPMPHALPGSVPFTGAATSGYAEAYVAGVARAARRSLFEAFWHSGADLGNPRTVRGLIGEAIMAGHSPSEPVARWGYAVDVSGGPVSSQAWHLVRDWRGQWQALGGTVPSLVVDGRALIGVEAVDWLGQRLQARGLDSWDGAARDHPAA